MPPVSPSAPPPPPSPEPAGPLRASLRSRPPTEGKAVVALSLAIFGLAGTVCGLGLVFGAPAVVLAVLALRDIGRSHGQLGGGGVATAAAVLGLAASMLFFAWVAAVSFLLVGPRELAMPSKPRIEPSGPSWPAADPGRPADPGSVAPGLSLHRAGGPLALQLAREVSSAEASGESVLVETTANGCEACDEVENAMLAPETRGALERVRVVGIDLGEFRSELGRLRMDESTAPWFYLLDAHGEPRDAISAAEWDDNDATQIAPVLRAFVHGRLRARRHGWHHGTTL
jgi:hypothetical protein